MDSSPAPEMRRRNWLDLPPEVTVTIMSRLVAVDIFTSVQLVCKAWLEIAKDPLVWRRIDMSSGGYRNRKKGFAVMCRRAVDRSCGQLADVNIEHFGSDELLKYITDRPNKIKRFRLACCDGVSDEGLSKALVKLPLLEDVDFTFCAFYESCDMEPFIIKSIGSFCRNLKSFRLNRRPQERDIVSSFFEDYFNSVANAINLHMPNLRHLQLLGNLMTNKGLEAILDGCSKLESLDLRKCHSIRMKSHVWKRCTRQIKYLRLPDEPTIIEFDYGTRSSVRRRHNGEHQRGRQRHNEERQRGRE